MEPVFGPDRRVILNLFELWNLDFGFLRVNTTVVVVVVVVVVGGFIMRFRILLSQCYAVVAKKKLRHLLVRCQSTRPIQSPPFVLTYTFSELCSIFLRRPAGYPLRVQVTAHAGGFPIVCHACAAAASLTRLTGSLYQRFNTSPNLTPKGDPERVILP